MILTRTANRYDVDWMFQECKAFSEAYPSKFSLAGNETYARVFISNLIQNHLVIVAVKDGERAGFIAGMIGPHHFNPDIKHLTEIFWWVPPALRMTGVGAKLFLEFVAFGKANCDCITMTLEKDTGISDAALEKRGFKLTEKAYLLECR